PRDLSYLRSLASSFPRPLRATLFPYTTLFRSYDHFYGCSRCMNSIVKCSSHLKVHRGMHALAMRHNRHTARKYASRCCICGLIRSEEHTSELQSRFDLVCRLLLEKKKQIHVRS